MSSQAAQQMQQTLARRCCILGQHVTQDGIAIDLIFLLWAQQHPLRTNLYGNVGRLTQHGLHILRQMNAAFGIQFRLFLGGLSQSTIAQGQHTVSILGDRVDYAPFGIEGGGPAAANEVQLVIDGAEVIPAMRSKAEKLALKAGDRIRLASPGGGGFGDPAARPPAAIEEDLNNGLVTASNASGIYAASVTRSGELAGRPLYRVAR